MKRLKNFNLPFKILVSFSILVALVIRMDGHIIEDLAEHIRASAWAYATLFMVIQFVLLSFRWEMLINIGKRHMNFKDALKINLTSQLANLIFITSIGGMLARIALSVQHGATVFKSLIATVFDRLMTLGALIVLAALFIPGLAKHVDNQTFATFSTLISTFVITMFVFAPMFLNFVILRMPQVTKLKGRMRYGVRYLKVLLNNPILCGKIVLISLVAQMGLFVSVFFLTQSTGADITFLQLMTVLPIISIVAALPISIGGWGVREGAFVYGLGLLGVPMETAFLVSVQVGLISMLTTVLTGLPALMAANIKLGSLQNLKETLAHVKI